jgi:conjugal transfer mating pair stabilization protein TraN
MRDSMDRRAQFAPQDLDATIARSNVISDDPLSYTSGMALAGARAAASPCLRKRHRSALHGDLQRRLYRDPGDQDLPGDAECRVEQRQVYGYYCVGGSGVDPASIYNCNRYPAPQCTVTQSYPINLCDPYFGIYWGCNSGDLRVDLVSCTAPVDGATPYTRDRRERRHDERDESQCAGLAADSSCQQDTETCTDSDPVTRIVDGIAVTQPCWAWSAQLHLRPIHASSGLPDAGSTPGCSLVREDCLSGEPCRPGSGSTTARCPDQPANTSQFICDGDVYCIDGSCETIEREANDEFKDAVVASTRWTRRGASSIPTRSPCSRARANTCSSKVFGVLNCCKGKGFPLIPGIQLLVALGCSREECCFTSAMRRACAPMSAPIARQLPRRLPDQEEGLLLL